MKDIKYFLSQNFRVDAIDGSEELCRIASDYTGIKVKKMLFQELDEIEKYGSEQLIALVAHGDIDYAVCDESIARSAVDSLPQLDINTAISFTQFYSWGVSKQSPVLLDSLNAWLSGFREGKDYKMIYRKYYGKN